MAYIDFNMRPPEAAETAHADAPPDSHTARASPEAKSRAGLWIALGVAGLIAALLFALALTAIGEPWTAILVTTVLLLPGASLFGGDGRRR